MKNSGLSEKVSNGHREGVRADSNEAAPAVDAHLVVRCYSFSVVAWSADSAPPHRIISATAMATTSRWKSNPAPCWSQHQFMKDRCMFASLRLRYRPRAG
jgi:hypothetical protein